MVGGLFRKIMTYVGGGAKAIKYFCFGREHPKPRLCSHCLRMLWTPLPGCHPPCPLCPGALKACHCAAEYEFPGNCYSERDYLPDIFASMQKAHGLIAKAEDILWPGERAPATVAILA